MRRKDREVKDFSKVIEILQSCDCCRLGFVDGDEAYIVPMNFGYDINGEEITLYFHCAKEGRKIDLLPKQSKVTFEMDTKHEMTGGEKGCDFSYLYQSIMGTGTLEAVSEERERIHGLQRIMYHYTNKEDWEFDESLVKITTVLKYKVKNLSCKEH